MENVMEKFLLLVFFFTIINGQSTPPNIVVILIDDAGMGDLPIYNSPTSHWFYTPAINQLAQEGLRFTSWYTAASICTPSRAALMTGRLPIRSGLTDRVLEVFTSASQLGGIQPGETTLAEALKSGGYMTGMTGKWHLGHNDLNLDVPINRDNGAHLPYKQGFDYSSLVATLGNFGVCTPDKDTGAINGDFCFLMRDGLVTQRPWNLDRFVDKMAYEFGKFLTLADAQHKPYFWFHSFLHVHTPFFTGEPFKSHNASNVFQGVVEEMDYGVGLVMEKIRAHDNNTVVFLVSDNGAFLEDFIDVNADQSSSFPYKSGKGTVYEGGFRVPAVVWWPGRVPANTVTNAVASSMDIFPTALTMAGIPIPPSFLVDGKDLTNFLRQPNVKPSPWKNQIYPFFCGQELMAVRYNQYKLYYKAQNFVDTNNAPTRADQCHGECCPGAGNGATGACSCANTYAYVDGNGAAILSFGARVIDYGNQPALFNIVDDVREQNRLTPANFPSYASVVADIQTKVDQLKATLTCLESTQMRLPTENPILQPWCKDPTTGAFLFHVDANGKKVGDPCDFEVFPEFPPINIQLP